MSLHAFFVLFPIAGFDVTVDMAVVFGLVALALVLFVTEPIPVDVTAILLMVLLMVLSPWTQISPAEGLSGFSSPATITVLAMLILSAGISQTGLVQWLGRKMAAFAGDDPFKQLFATIGIAGPASGFINNTPVVAILVPVVSDLAHQGKSSPSKLLMPLSFASMFGGMLTVIGTSTNILASDVSDRLLGRSFSMFEFTELGIIILFVGTAYLLTIGNQLLPERIEPRDDLIEEYELEAYLTEAIVLENSPFVGSTVAEAGEMIAGSMDVLQLDRAGETFVEPLAQKSIRADDVLTLRTDRNTLQQLIFRDGLTIAGSPTSDAELEVEDGHQTLVEVIIPSGSSLIGETLESVAFRGQYNANVLAFRSREQLIQPRMDDRALRVGDTLLVQAPADSIDRLSRSRDFIVAHEPDQPEYRTEKIPVALLILGGVVLLPAAGILPIVVSALGGVVAMVLTGVLKPAELYDSVDWNVIFLLAGVIPLGVALEKTGAAELLGQLVASSATVLPALAVLWVFYLATALLTNVVSNNASVVLMIPVAIQAAEQLDVNAFAFVIGVTFAASTAFMTPVGYQTNLFVYGPGGYRFTDYFRVGAPLQLLLSVVTVVGIAMFWGL